MEAKDLRASTTKRPKKGGKGIKLKKINMDKVKKPKHSVNELLERTMHKSKTLKSITTVLVSYNRIKHLVDNQGETPLDPYSSQLSVSPGRPRTPGGSLISGESLLGTQRSWSSYSMDGSETTITSRLTQRELVREINIRAKKNLAAPNYVTPMDELPQSQLTWHHRPTSPYGAYSPTRGNSPGRGNGHPYPSSRTGSPTPGQQALESARKPRIDIIGCMHPIELILSQADQRTRLREEKVKAREAICQEKIKQLNEAIHLKYTRAERYALILEQKQRQMKWMVVLRACSFLKNAWSSGYSHISKVDKFANTVSAAHTIRHACSIWMKRHLRIKFKHKFMKKLKENDFAFRINVRVRRKRNAMDKIVTFLNEYKGHHRMNVVVHKYLTGVHKVQRVIRDYLACKSAKLVVLSKLWMRLERQYVKRMLDRRKQQKRSTGRITHQAEDMQDFDSKTLIEMKNQAKLWTRIDNKMENRLRILKATGVITVGSEDEAIDKFLLPVNSRTHELVEMLQFLRKEHYNSQRAVMRRKIEMESTFQESHAHDMLRGFDEDISRIVMEKFDKTRITLKYKPFMLFSSISHEFVMERIIHAHQVAETFAIRIDEFDMSKKKQVIEAKRIARAAATASIKTGRAPKQRRAEVTSTDHVANSASGGGGGGGATASSGSILAAELNDGSVS